MKCTNTIYYGWTKQANKDSGKKPKKLGYCWDTNIFIVPKNWIVDKTVTCDGEIKFQINTIEEPTWGGTYPTLDVDGFCPECRDTFWGKLVKDNIDNIVNDALNAKHVRDYEKERQAAYDEYMRQLYGKQETK